jgi:hypothetical protein
MSPLSTSVLAAATVVSSPALWLGLVDRTLPLDVTLTRYLIALVLCWAAVSLVATWAFPDPRSVRVETKDPDPRSEGFSGEPVSGPVEPQ